MVSERDEVVVAFVEIELSLRRGVKVKIRVVYDFKALSPFPILAHMPSG